MNRKYQDGYTLIEILVTLTIIALLFGFGYASFRDFSRRQSVIDAASMIQGDLRLAQSDAISGQKPTQPTTCSTTLDSYYFLIVSQTEYKIQANCGPTPIDVKDVILPSDVSIPTPFPSPNPLQFKVLDQGTTAGASNWVLTLTQAGTKNSSQVAVTSGGEIGSAYAGIITPAPSAPSGHTPISSPTDSGKVYGCKSGHCVQISDSSSCKPNYSTNKCGSTHGIPCVSGNNHPCK